MPTFKYQTGFSPIIIIIGLLSLTAVTAGGYYAFTANESAKLKEASSLAPTQSQTPSIQQVKEANEDTLLSMDGVKDVEVGEKDGKPCVVVFTFKETDELQNLENSGLGGYEVIVQNDTQTN